MLEPVAAATERLGFESLIGPLLLAALSFVVAATVAMIALRPDPLSLAPPAPVRKGAVLVLAPISLLARYRSALVQPQPA